MNEDSPVSIEIVGEFSRGFRERFLVGVDDCDAGAALIEQLRRGEADAARAAGDDRRKVFVIAPHIAIGRGTKNWRCGNSSLSSGFPYGLGSLIITTSFRVLPREQASCFPSSDQSNHVIRSELK